VGPGSAAGRRSLLAMSRRRNERFVYCVARARGAIGRRVYRADALLRRGSRADGGPQRGCSVVRAESTESGPARAPAPAGSGRPISAARSSAVAVRLPQRLIHDTASRVLGSRLCRRDRLGRDTRARDDNAKAAGSWAIGMGPATDRDFDWPVLSAKTAVGFGGGGWGAGGWFRRLVGG